MDLGAKRARIEGKGIELTPREWGLLELLLTRSGRVLSKDQIAEHLLVYDDQISSNAIEVYISRLRAKIEPMGSRIRTVRGFGYIWEAANE